MRPDVSIQVVNYFSEEHLFDFAQSLKEALCGTQWEILVWDNSGADQTQRERILGLGEGIRWYGQGENIGFARAHNELAKRAGGEFLIIANPDSKVEANTVQRLLMTWKENQRIGLLVPAFNFPGGRLQPNQLARQNIWWELTQSFFLDTLPFWNFGIPGLRKKLTEGKPFPIGWGSGAFSLIPKAVWAELGGYDPNFFFGGEDDDFCRRVWAAGWEVWCEPRAKVFHVLHGSIGRELDRKVIYYYQKRLYFAFKHFSKSQYYFLKIISCFELCYKWVIGWVISNFNSRWEKKKQGYKNTLRLIFSPRYKHPGEWVSSWLASNGSRERTLV